MALGASVFRGEVPVRASARHPETLGGLGRSVTRGVRYPKLWLSGITEIGEIFVAKLLSSAAPGRA